MIRPLRKRAGDLTPLASSTEDTAGERAHGTDHGHIVQVHLVNGMISTRLAKPDEWFCGHCGMGAPEATASGTGGVRPLASVCPCGCSPDMHIGEIGCPCGLPDEPPCTLATDHPDCREERRP